MGKYLPTVQLKYANNSCFSLNNKVYAVKMQQITNKHCATFQDEKLDLKNAGGKETKH